MATDDERDIYDAGMEPDEAPPPPAPDPQPQPPAAASAEEPPAAQSAETPSEEPQPPQHTVPLRELLDTRERAQAAERQAQELARRLEAYERQRQQQERASQQPPPAAPDMFQDPEGYATYVQRQIDTRVSEIEQARELRETQRSFAQAARTHGETFDQAWNEFQRAASAAPALQQAFRQLDPLSRGEEIVGWFKQQRAVQEVGSDPAAYRAKVLEEALNDQAFLAQVVERVRGNGAQPTGSRPQNVTRLPPSLNRATGASARPGEDDGSDEAIWAHANRK